MSFHFKNFKGIASVDFINTLNLEIAYSLNQQFADNTLSIFPSAKLVCDSSVLLETIARERKFNLNNAIYTFIENDTLSVFAFEDSKLLLFNQDHIQNNSDTVYYLLKVVETCKFSNESVQLKILNLSNSLQESLSSFFNLVEPYPAINYGISNADNHLIFLLHKQQKCVL